MPPSPRLPTFGPSAAPRASLAILDMSAPAQDKKLERLVLRIVDSVQPSPNAIRRDIQGLRDAYPHLSNAAIAELWSNRICRRYAAEGALSAVPSVIPGLGTSAQLVLEGGAIAADLGFMLRCMADIVHGVAEALGRCIESNFNEEFVQVLATWCGETSIGKSAAMRLGSRIALAQAKRLPSEVVKRLQRRVARDLLAQFGVRRSGVALGRLIPFGVGALVGGSFNYATMQGFKTTALVHFRHAIRATPAYA